MIKGQIVGGDFDKLIIRQKHNKTIELGELLVTEYKQNNKKHKIILQVYDLRFGSQISSQNLEFISGMSLEDNAKTSFIDEENRNYNMIFAKPLLQISDEHGTIEYGLCKQLPKFFGQVREITKEDIIFITKPENPLFLGQIRSGRKILDADVFLDGKKVIPHHILIPATTGRGKSNLAKVLVWSIISSASCGLLILDPHDEYFGRNNIGMKDHPEKNRILYYTPDSFPNSNSLIINLKDIRPDHLKGVFNFSDPQLQLIYMYYKKYQNKWIEYIIKKEDEYILDKFSTKGTYNVVRRNIMNVLDIRYDAEKDIFMENSIFCIHSGETTISSIINNLHENKIVIVDTSSFSGKTEMLIGSIITSKLFSKNRYLKKKGKLQSPIGILLEEAPRVLGKEVLEKGSNIFESIAREGRKFGIGLVAITQLPSLIPRTILANMNTKIILGLEMAPERQAIIESASQDLTSDSKTISSLDKGEAIITSSLLRFAIPIRIPLFETFAKENIDKKKNNYVMSESDFS